ncbi:MAG: 3-deoxy-D-manno-octulosonic acid transferase, partial [Candidatus Hydrogenedentes bacterium]|nr:3-deoxy-D-manno-octulosonic acid transferase [Candidatus Hydrogenedentota bacterium]
MAYLLYNTALALLTPPAKVWLRRQERHRPLLARFAPVVPPFSDAPLWIHACSVGEVGTARPLIAALKETLPNVPILLTTSTVAGRGQADKLNGDVA